MTGETTLAGGPLEMVTAEKQRRLRQAAETWLAARPELARLSDRELADIGISRSEITAVAWSNARTTA